MKKGQFDETSLETSKGGDRGKKKRLRLGGGGADVIESSPPAFGDLEEQRELLRLRGGLRWTRGGRGT